jgi:hypothetical protein
MVYLMHIDMDIPEKDLKEGYFDPYYDRMCWAVLDLVTSTRLNQNRLASRTGGS